MGFKVFPNPNQSGISCLISTEPLEAHGNWERMAGKSKHHLIFVKDTQEDLSNHRLVCPISDPGKVTANNPRSISKHKKDKSSSL